MTPQEYNAIEGILLTPDGLPVWSGITDVVEQIEELMDLQERLGLRVIDGKLGPKTIAAIGREDYERQKQHLLEGQGLLVFGPKAYIVNFPVTSFIDGGIDGLPSSRRIEPVTQGVIHYSVTRDNRHTRRVLAKREYSVHIAIQFDGSIAQYLDPVTRYAYHVGGTNARRPSGKRISGNPHTVGVEISAWALPSKQADHVRRWGAPRPHARDFKVRGKQVHFEGEEHPGVLGYSLEEERSLRAVCLVCSRVFGIPWAWPEDPYDSLEDPLGFRGWVGHCSVKDTKTDPAPLDFDRALGGREESC